MGIRNLSSFITNFEDLRKDSRLSDTYVVIDGNNLKYDLYGKYNKRNPNDSLFGGNYTDYRLFFNTFFRNLKKCKVRPVFVIDGGLNLELMDNRRNRFKKSFTDSQKLSENPPELESEEPVLSNLFFPYLWGQSLLSAANEWNRLEDKEPDEDKRNPIIILQTCLDSDLESAKLAKELRCPLITNDSDFLIMSIDEGIISCDSLLWETPLELNRNYIECKVYKVNDFVAKFGIKPEMLPIFGTLMGNDYIDDHIFEDLFLDMVQETRFDPQFNGSAFDSNQALNERWVQMNRLLYWLSHKFFCANQAIDYIEKYLKNKEIDSKEFRASLKSYETNEKTFLKQLFDYKLNKTEDTDIPIDKIIGDYRFPKWFLCEYFLHSKLDPILFSFIESKFFFIRPLIEDFSRESCFESIHELYGFLLGLLRLKHDDMTPIRISTRNGSDYIELEIQPKTYITHSTGGDKTLPILSEIRELSDNQRKELILDIFEFKHKWIIHLEDCLSSAKFDKQDIDFWRYFLIVVKYWTSKTKIKCHYFEFIRALVLSVIQNRHQSLTRNEFKDLNCVLKLKFEPTVVHNYNEFQVIYKSIDGIMSLLGNPVPSPYLHHYFNGTLFYNLFGEVLAGRLTLCPFKEYRLNTLVYFIIGSICMK